MARSTVSAVVEKVRRELMGQRDEVNLLDSATDDTQTSMVMQYALDAGMVPGAILSIGQETMRVMAVDTSTLTATVIRGFAGSTAVAHDYNEQVWVNPRFTAHEILDELEDEMRSWPPGLFRVVSDTITTTDGLDTYELPATFIGTYGLLDVRRQWDIEDSTAWPRMKARLQRGDAAQWTDVSTSGVLLRFLTPVSAGMVYVQLAMPFDFTSLSYEADLVDDCGLSESLIDVAAMGTRARLMEMAEAGRSQRRGQDDSRRAEEVPPLAAMQAAAAYRQRYLARRTEEIARLAALYPLRMT